MEIEEIDHPKTAFLTPYGLCEHCRMPFGHCNAPATFQHAMMLLLRGLTWEEVLAYLDDVTILGKDFYDHPNNLITIFQRFRYNNLKLKPKKCFLFQTQIMFLGKLVTKNGLSVNPDSTSVITKWPKPTTVKEVQKFLGLVNYHHTHLKDFGNIAQVLYDLPKKGEKFAWTQEHGEAFEKLKSALISAPCLAFPRNTSEPFALDTDASEVEKLISYGSFILTQRNY